MIAISPKLWHTAHSLDLISGSRWRWPKAVAKSCGGHIQSIPHVIQAVANLSSYSLGSQRGSILYGTLRHSFYLILRSSVTQFTGLGNPSGETTAPWFIARIAGQNQYNKLLGNVRITVREFGSDRIQYSKLLEIMISSNFKYINIQYYIMYRMLM